MTQIYKCKGHNYEHDYTVCPACRHQYCERTWKACPRCAEQRRAALCSTGHDWKLREGGIAFCGRCSYEPADQQGY